ncbi:MAG TPA: hypothetical protein VNA17_05985 [Pyrinomonadaceae bacterium]|nr:hypothetical protein [Pyrinomonadaceae bacterium]
MCKQYFTLGFAFAAMMSLSFSTDAQTRASVSAAEVNGTFRMNFKGKFKDASNDIKILALGRGKIRVAMDLLYPYTLSGGERTANLGELDGEASIAGDTAVFESNEFGNCRITIRFVRPGTIKVIQDAPVGNCGFGHNVSAGGTYRKVSARKPTFGASK